ncbi:MAG: type IX secretion system sortase PorU, partial [Bacteroidales bacterium]|nr:type IX secretion system sortase PorU [Bacteroidales bacterium]
PGLTFEFEVLNTQFANLEIEDISTIADADLIGNTILFKTENVSVREKNYIIFKMLPLRKNESTGNFEKLISFDLDYQIVHGGASNYKDGSVVYAENSVLATGEWFKISVGESGIYKVSWQDLSDLGMSMSNIPSDKLQVFGNGGGMLPQKNRDFRHDDLMENALWVEDGGDGNFDQGDYFLFYGQSPHTWTFKASSRIFQHSTNKFTNKNYYFVTVGQEPGQRVEAFELSAVSAEKIFNTYNDLQIHESDIVSLIKSGEEWYGEEFNENLIQDFNFIFPDRDLSKEVFIDCDFAGKSTSTSSFTAFINNDSVFRDNISAISEGSITKFANPSNRSAWHMANTSPDLTVTLKYNRKDGNSVGWLNYISLNVSSNLKFNGHQFSFRNIDATGNNEVGEFRISGANENLKVWDITSLFSPRNVALTIENETGKFAFEMDSLREFIAFDGSDFMKPELHGHIPNQNLHALQTAEFIIVSHPDFLQQSERLAALHETMDGMHVIVVNLFDIYNEFSSGAPDVTAIRDFIRMIYLRSGTPPVLKYVLLFGDGSYDPLDRVGGNLSFVPTFQSAQSLWYTSTYVTDDYFGLMDLDEGKDASGNVDLGVGRFAVNNPEDAKLMVDKVEDYLKLDASKPGSWRNLLTFIADDEDNNLHVYQADTILIPLIQRNNKSVNFRKIYFDSYAQQSNASGQSYPQATSDINSAVEDGCLIVNYTGHGGELGLSHEKVVQISDILSWNNRDALPVFITATCEFSRFDNPSLTSAGELVLVNHNGGGLALFTTTRLAFASSNLLLNKRLYDTLFRAYPEIHPRLGDLMMYSKTPSNTNLRNFVLLGDPALKLALPGFKVVTDSINGIPAAQYNDTLNAGGKISVSGHIESYYKVGETVEDFNGIIYPTLYDKPTNVTTLGNDPKSYPYTFEAQNSILYKGKASINNGRFSFSFVLPLDISYQFGKGKLSYYASDSLRDAGGYFSEILIGGNSDGSTDKSGPEIGLYLNEKKSEIPNLINPDPVLFIELSDPSGINYLGTGIGHDIMLTMDGTSYNHYILNEKFDPVMDDFTSGNIVFHMENLPNGEYTLDLKAWDMLNNSSVKSISFNVSDNIDVEVLEVYNYPNPFKDFTWFTFRHNQYQGELSVEIDIYNFFGEHVRTIGPKNVFTDGYTMNPILWEGDSEGGSKLESGFYFYTIKVSNEKDHFTERIQKLIITE